ncbi:hypothetical protein ETAC_03650 [Edwardsiella piscicida C07-087]|uniref:Uncharacterized protein n=1 Tax=Edwardsiella tarda (strain FL6-60) TaxID=718251 RepID=A0A0H3DNK5_EDWTF|nr:hypothetical protein ETAF_0697 [Edwardsiella tarda FL6-60]AGH72861.1 hypothetical protein ETAC_03650 [Edwardsiella piscicida C07-087]
MIGNDISFPYIINQLISAQHRIRMMSKIAQHVDESGLKYQHASFAGDFIVCCQY